MTTNPFLVEPVPPPPADNESMTPRDWMELLGNDWPGSNRNSGREEAPTEDDVVQLEKQLSEASDELEKEMQSEQQHDGSDHERDSEGHSNKDQPAAGAKGNAISLARCLEIVEEDVQKLVVASFVILLGLLLLITAGLCVLLYHDPLDGIPGPLRHGRLLVWVVEVPSGISNVSLRLV